MSNDNDVAVHEIRVALDQAKIDIRDCERGLDNATSELSNVESNVEEALDQLDNIETGNDEQVQFLERDIEILKEKLRAAEDIIERQRLSIEEIGVIAADELS